MAQYTVMLAFLTLLATSCQNVRYPTKPKNLIPEEQMAEILVDIHLFNEAKILNKRLLEESGLAPYPFIFEKHDIDSVRFEDSQAYYSAHIEKYRRIYEQVQKRLEGLKDESDKRTGK